MRRTIIAVLLVTGLAVEGHGQVSICQGQICVALPPMDPQLTTPAPTPRPPQQVQPTAAAAAVVQPAIQATQYNHTKAIVITAVVSAVGTWALVKLFKRKASK